ncbi:hypothetical protein [Streptomyces sp. NPDC046197]|uniref:hypothetical protein n=1 Tax=Streptomyces sp. NPDC046197 TaxID=3154337 RepID=UPI0033E68D1B
MCTPMEYEPDRVAVIRGKAPSFPNTANGQSVLTKTRLRYWSLCQNRLQIPYAVSSCAADFQTSRSKDGRDTYVVSTSRDRPHNATTANGITWIDWGPTNVQSVLFLRNMLPAQNLTNAVQDVKKGD